MSDREFEGKDLEEAIDSASSALGVSGDELHYEMVEQGRRGLLGLGTRNVRIRVKPPLDVEIPLDDEEIPLAPPAAEDERSDQPRRRRSRSRRRGGAGRKRANSNAREPRPERERPSNRVAVDKPLVDEAVAQQVAGTLTQIVDLMQLELSVDATPEKGGVSLSLQGGDQLQLTADNSELLLAMQFLLNRMSRRSWPEAGRIKLFTDGEADEPRDEQLVALTHQIAAEVSQSGKTQKMRPMNAYERRLVHLTVREYPGLSSSSDGRGAMKRVRISKIQNQI